MQLVILIGLHLMKLAQVLPEQYDLHELHRLLSSLDPYEHLHCVFHLCSVHVAWNIKQAKVSNPVKVMMNSLVCIEHLNFDGTLEKIKTDGGKVGSGQDIILQLLNILLNNFQKYLAWVHDKIHSKFALPGICWQRSFIPIDIWQAGDNTSNVIESLHFDVNSEGKRCTLVGGMQAGHRFDLLKIWTLQVSSNHYNWDLAINPCHISRCKNNQASMYHTIIVMVLRIQVRNWKGNVHSFYFHILKTNTLVLQLRAIIRA